MSAQELNPYMCSQPTTYSQYDENLLIPAIAAQPVAVLGYQNAVQPVAVLGSQNAVQNAMNFGLEHHNRDYLANALHNTEHKHNAGDPITSEYHKKAVAFINDMAAIFKREEKTLFSLVDRINKADNSDSRTAYIAFHESEPCRAYTYLLNKEYNRDNVAVQKDSEKTVRVHDILSIVVKSILVAADMKRTHEKILRKDQISHSRVHKPEDLPKNFYDYMEKQSDAIVNKNLAHGTSTQHDNTYRDDTEDRASRPTAKQDLRHLNNGVDVEKLSHELAKKIQDHRPSDNTGRYDDASTKTTESVYVKNVVTSDDGRGRPIEDESSNPMGKEDGTR